MLVIFCSITVSFIARRRGTFTDLYMAVDEKLISPLVTPRSVQNLIESLRLPTGLQSFRMVPNEDDFIGFATLPSFRSSDMRY